LNQPDASAPRIHYDIVPDSSVQV